MLKIDAIHTKGGAEKLAQALRQKGISVYVGIPATSATERAAEVQSLAGTVTGKRAKHLADVAKQDVNNAELLYIFSKGSPARNQPPRPVLEPAIEADGNKQIISRELAGMAKAHLDEDKAKEKQYAERAGIAGQNAARDWFTDERNHWKENAPSTIAAKGSDRPGIDFGLMRAAIVYLTDEGK